MKKFRIEELARAKKADPIRPEIPYRVFDERRELALLVLEALDGKGIHEVKYKPAKQVAVATALAGPPVPEGGKHGRASTKDITAWMRANASG